MTNNTDAVAVPTFSPSAEYQHWWSTNGPKLAGHSIYSKGAVIWDAATATERAAIQPAVEAETERNKVWHWSQKDDGPCIDRYDRGYEAARQEVREMFAGPPAAPQEAKAALEAAIDTEESMQIKVSLMDELAEQEAKAEQEAECGACHGSGWVVRDPDIGTEQECFSCGGSGVDTDIAPSSEASADLPDATDHYGIDSFYHEPAAPSGSIGERLHLEDIASRLQGAMNAAPRSNSAEVSKVTLQEAIAALAARTPAIAGSIAKDLDFWDVINTALVDHLPYDARQIEFAAIARVADRFIDTIIQGANRG